MDGNYLHSVVSPILSRSFLCLQVNYIIELKHKFELWAKDALSFYIFCLFLCHSLPHDITDLKADGRL